MNYDCDVGGDVAGCLLDKNYVEAPLGSNRPMIRKSPGPNSGDQAMKLMI